MRDIISHCVIWRNAFKLKFRQYKKTWNQSFWDWPLMCGHDVTFRRSRSGKRLNLPNINCGSWLPNPWGFSLSLATADFSLKSFAEYVWWRVFEAWWRICYFTDIWWIKTYPQTPRWFLDKTLLKLATLENQNQIFFVRLHGFTPSPRSFISSGTCTFWTYVNSFTCMYC